ncbi:MAG: fibronectin type III domain-containing protein [Parvularculaceae bacterium]
MRILVTLITCIGMAIALVACSSGGGSSTPPPTGGASAPTGLQTSSVNGDTVQLAWSPSGSFSGYRIYRDGVQIGSTTGSSFTDTGLSPGTTYTYYIRGETASGLSPQSGTITVTTASAGAFQLSKLLDPQNRGRNFVRDVAFDSAGNIVVVGGAWDSNFPTTPGAYDRTFATGGTTLGREGPADAFVMKLDRAGNIIWSTLVGGPNYDRAYAVEVAPDGGIVIAGRAGEGFPTTAGVVQPNFAGDSNPNRPYGHQDGFIAKLSSDGSTLLWSTYYGDADRGIVRDIDIDSQNRIYVAGVFGSTFPHITANAVQPNVHGAHDLVYSRLNANASTVQYATFIGGAETSGSVFGTPSIRVTPSDDAYLLTYETGNGAPTTGASYQQNNAGGYDFLVARFNSSDQLVYATYLGGAGEETLETHQLEVDSAGRAIIAGICNSSNYPTTSGVYQPAFGGGNVDGCISILSANGSSLAASTYLGGGGNDGLEGVAIAPNGEIFVSGATRSSGLSTSANAFQRRFGGVEDGLIAVFGADLKTAPFRSFIGGSGVDTLRAAGLASDGALVFGGLTESSNYPVTTGPAMTTPIDTFTGVIGLYTP